MKLLACIRASFDPFSNESSDGLCFINNGYPMPNNEQLSQSLRTLWERGQQLYERFHTQRLVECTIPLTDTISQNNILLPSNNHLEADAKYKFVGLKEEQKLLQTLKCTAVVRPEATLACLRYEPYNTPQCFVTKEGMLYQAAKSTLLPRLKTLNKTPEGSLNVVQSAGPSQLIVDLSMMTLSTAQTPGANFVTIKNLCDQVWQNIEELRVENSCTRIDIVSDDYQNEHPIKSKTRASRGQGTKVAFELDSRFKSKIGDFLHNEDNKDGLYTIMTNYFKKKIAETSDNSIYVMVYGEETILGSVPTSTHREADYRIVLHVIDGIARGFLKIIVRANDTDITIILMAFMPVFLQLCPSLQLTIYHGTGNNRVLFNLNHMATNFGKENCRSLLFFHALTGCDYNPSFFGIGKCRFFDELVRNIGFYRKAFTELSLSPMAVTSDHMIIVKEFIIGSYGDDYDTLEDARLDTLIHSLDPSLRKWPPSSGALFEHTKRAAYIAGHLWGNANVARPDLPSLEDWGFKTASGICIPHWSSDCNENAYKAVGNSCGCRYLKHCIN